MNKPHQIHSTLTQLDSVLTANLLLMGVTLQTSPTTTRYRFGKQVVFVRTFLPNQIHASRYNLKEEEYLISIYWHGLDYSDYFDAYASFYTLDLPFESVEEYSHGTSFSSNKCIELWEAASLAFATNDYYSCWESDDDADHRTIYIARSTTCPALLMAQRFLNALLSEFA